MKIDVRVLIAINFMLAGMFIADFIQDFHQRSFYWCATDLFLLLVAIVVGTKRIKQLGASK